MARGRAKGEGEEKGCGRRIERETYTLVVGMHDAVVEKAGGFVQLGCHCDSVRRLWMIQGWLES